MKNANNSKINNDEIIGFDHIFINVFIVVFVGFTVHRIVNFKFLSEAIAPDSQAKAFLVGSLSDIWVGCLLALVVSPMSFATRRVGKTLGVMTQLLFFLVFSGTLSAHQGYVEFFRFQLEPFHLSYLFDVQFIGSNVASFLTSSNIAMTFLVGITAALMYARNVNPTAAGRTWAVIAMLSALAVFAHNRNIHYRVQWFVPENLQTNVFESLYLRFKKLGNAEKLLPEDFLTAKILYNNGLTPKSGDRYQSTIFSSALQENPIVHPIATALKQTFRNHVDRGTRPTIVVVLLESLRPAETGIFAPNLKTITPQLDAIAKNGIWFRNAFSTGSVTRSGQEACSMRKL